MTTRIAVASALWSASLLVLVLAPAAWAQDAAGSAPASSAEPAPAELPSAPGAQADLPASSETVEGTAAAEPAPLAADEGALEMSAEELAALGLTSDATGGGAAVDTAFKLYGFADFGVLTVLGKRDNPWRKAFNQHASFAIGNFNVYLSKNLTEKMRMFSEVRLTFLPNGSEVEGSPTGDFVTTSAQDYADFKRRLRWAGIEIERVYLEYAPLRALVIRAGVFLTPYGIWNVDHGSPTIVAAQRPFVIGAQLFPERQTGFEVLGSVSGAHNTFGYHLTLSNGMGPISEYRDLDDNKALGARVYWSNDRFGEVRLGGSLFYGSDTSARSAPALSADGQRIVYDEKIDSQSDVLSLAADLRWSYKGLLVQSEFIAQQRRYEEEGRQGAVNPLAGQYLAPRDKLNLGFYGLVGYRFEWFGVMPYVLMQTMDYTNPAELLPLQNWSVFAGLNVRPIDVFVLKLEFSHGAFWNEQLISNRPLRLGQFQLAWAF